MATMEGRFGGVRFPGGYFSGGCLHLVDSGRRSLGSRVGGIGPLALVLRDALPARREKAAEIRSQAHLKIGGQAVSWPGAQPGRIPPHHL
jgi:hypothetical protein